MGVADAGVPLVEVIRGGIVESLHLGAIAAIDADGSVRWSAGDTGLITFPRSSLKPLQLLALVELGGVERFGFQSDELAVMAGSHGGEVIHIERVQRILEKIEAPPEALMCGVQKPLNAQVASPTALHNNCSGKHAGMLALARLLGAPLEDYINPSHRAQQAIREVLVDLLQVTTDKVVIGMDGCSAPAYALPLHKMARGFALLGCARFAPEWHRAALQLVGDAMRQHPELVAATSGRVDTELMRANPRLVAKSGAEGYFAVGHADGVGLTLKVIDGDAGGRARNLAVAMAVRRSGWLEDAAFDGALGQFGPRLPIRNLAGRVTGEIRPTALLAS